MLTPESRTVRNALLPREAPPIPGFDLAGGTSTHDDGAGDTLWDHFTMGDGRTGCLVLRASRGALPASFYLGLGRALFRGLGRDHETIAGLMEAVNRVLVVGTPEAGEQVLECGVILPTPSGVEWASAGGSPGGIIGRDGSFVEFTSQGPPMGVMEGFQYRVAAHPLSVGDSCLALSHASSGLFKGAADLVAGLAAKPVGEVVSTVHRAIRQALGEETEVSVLFMRRG